MAFGYYKSITIDHTQAGSADSTDFPLTIGLDGHVQSADADLKTVANGGYVEDANGYDIRPYADSGLTTPLDFELVFYEATTGKLEMHVRIPTLSHTTDTVIYLAFGDSGITTDGSSSSTWDSDYTNVYHFKDTGSSTLNLEDSTGANDGLLNGNPVTGGVTPTTGEIDGGSAYAAIHEGWVSDDVGSGANITIEFWSYPTDVTTNTYICSKQDFSGLYQDVILGYQDGSYNIYNNGYITGTPADTEIPADINTWQHIVIAGGWPNVKGYKNGVQIFSASGDFSNIGGSPGWIYGCYTPTGAAYIGKLDEFKISKSIRSASYILSMYNAQKPSSTFITWGSRVTVGGGPTEVEINKSLKYTVVSTPSAKTKSLKYTVIATPSAKTKSLKYTTTSTPAAITKSLEYVVSTTAPVSVTKSMKYTVISTPAAKTKSLKYGVVTVPSAKTKALIYAVKSPIQATKSLKYTVLASASKTKSLKYTVIVAVSKTKTLIYKIKIVGSVTKSLQYAVKKSTAITKSLQYRLDVIPHVTITKSLRYVLRVYPYTRKTNPPYTRKASPYTRI